MSSRPGIAALALGVLLVTPRPVHAEDEARAAPVAEGIVAVVDGEPLLWSDLRHVAAIDIASARAAPAAERATRMRAALRAGLTRLIEDALLAREAARLEIVVTPEEVTRAIESWAVEQGYGTTEGLMAAVAASYGKIDYRGLLSRVLLRAKVVQHHHAAAPLHHGAPAADMSQIEAALLDRLTKSAVIERRLIP